MTISVCMITFNGERYLRQQLDSILSQVGSDDEIIISDDGSSDMTVSIIESYNDDRIRLLSGPRQGVVKNVEHALKHASGDIIFLADQDDVWLENKVEVCLEYLKNATLVLSDCIITDVSLNPISKSYFQQVHPHTGLINNMYKNNYIGCCLAFRKELLKIALPFPNGVAMHDWWLGIMAELSGNVKFLDQPLMIYRRHDNNVSATSNVSTYNLRTKLVMRLRLVLAIISRIPSIIKDNQLLRNK